ncbi:hypothetical protein [Ferruginibacter sp.]|nr:hypothetical protein [Ferruginibacter sp.]
MIKVIQQYQKQAAWFMFLLFYGQFAAMAMETRYGIHTNKIITTGYSVKNSSLFNIPTNKNVFGETYYNKKEKTKPYNGSKISSIPADVKKGTIGGPGQPEMQAFQSVNANNMVDLFSGDFSYNIPLMDVGGYPVGLSYKGGVSMDQEASWVGLGWNINPGAVTRNVRGLPDDFNGTEKITKEFNTRKNWTAGVTADFKPEIFGIELGKKRVLGVNPSVGLGIFYNNYAGIGFEVSAGATVNPGKFVMTSKTSDDKGAATKYDTTSFSKYLGFSLGLTLNSQQGVSGDASLLLKYGKESSKFSGNGRIGTTFNSRSGIQDLQLSMENQNNKVSEKNKNSLFNGNFGVPVQTISFAKSAYTPTITMPVSSYGFALTLKGGGEFFGFHPLASLKGYYSQQSIAPKDRTVSLPAYGYMYSQKGNKDNSALLDFNREKDIPFRKQTPHAAIPVYTYDSYSITGEGIGGSFRPYRGDVGYIRDHFMQTKNGNGSIGLDFGTGNLAHFGGNLQLTYANAASRGWSGYSNFMEPKVRFTAADSTYENVYFRNPGEQTTNDNVFYNSIGGDDVVRPALAGGNMEPIATRELLRYDRQKYTGAVSVNTPLTKTKRDRRSQVISYLSAEEAQFGALDTVIKSFPVNVFPKGKCDSSFETIRRNDGDKGLRRPNHLSEVSVLNNDGKRYIYGTPAYNTGQKEVTFAVDSYQGNNTTGLATYTSGDNTTSNNRGKDNFFSSDYTPGFAHSFLLTSILSADYSDITGDGVTEDDNGDAIKFNYSRLKWGGNTNFGWRAPYDNLKATYNEGSKSDATDDKASYVYGQKEVWYLNSIESKTMIATFVLDTAVRKDGYGVSGEDGGRDNNAALKRLKEINLYSKSDYYKNPFKARPVKTVKFYYSYSLCTGSESSLSGYGKLTLDSLAFSYNGNKRSEKNKYRFAYNNNPVYNSKNNDRWGSYKPETDNPGSQLNADYPYAVQNKTKADGNAAAWNLTKITLPGGAKMSIDYESDDYGYVQDKRAMAMTKIAGMGNSPSATPLPNLYENLLLNTKDLMYVFIDVPVAVINSKTDIYRKYLEGAEQVDGSSKLYFKLKVKMPGTSIYETVPFYADYEDYGYVNANRIWIKLKEFGKDVSFPAIAALQYLRINHPGKAYPGSDMNGDASFKAIIQSLVGMSRQFKDMVVGFNKSKRQEQVCKLFDTSRSYVRLNTPGYTKFGGGYRVRRITISDNWNAMTGQKESYYGQEYDYTDTKEIFYDSSGIKKSRVIKISSGVASYEPNIGNEENPFRQPIEFQERVTLAPSDYLYSEYPYGESFFPSASVGYSKVRVSSINKRNLKSFNGWEESEFYTSKDFPTVTDYTTFDGDSRKTGKRRFNFINTNATKRTTLSQGFKIELNNMHGQMKSQKSYAANDSIRPVSYTSNYYRTIKDNIHGQRLDNTVAVMDSSNGKINPGGIIGKDMELMLDFREHQTTSIGVDINANADVFMAFIFPVTIPAFFPRFNLDDNRYRSAVAVKIIQRYGILDSVVRYEKGSLVSTKNLVYDAESGEALVTRTQNEFNDPIYNFSYPSYWKYSGVGPAYKNNSSIFSGVNVKGGKIINKIIDANLESGDELLVLTSNYIPVGLPGTDSCVAVDWQKSKAARKLWVVDVNKATNTPGRNLFLIDINGTPYNGADISFKIIRSGKRNLSGSIGAFTSASNPIQVINNDQWLLKADSTVGVLAAGASTYKDYWAVDNKFNSVVTCTGGPTAACDSLSKILEYFRKYVINQPSPPLTYDTFGCETSSWIFQNTPLVNNGTVKYKDLFTNPGIVGWPSSVTDTLLSTSTNAKLEVNKIRSICNLNGFTYEARIAAPSLSAPFGSGAKSLIIILHTNRNGTSIVDQFTFYGGGIIYQNTTPLPGISSFDIEPWKTYKVKFITDSIKLYVNDTLKGTVYAPGTATTINSFSNQFRAVNAKVDWIKLSLNNGAVVLNEQFNNGCSGFAQPLPQFRCGTNCQTDFANYFNSKTGKTYTFAQIDSIYKENCRYSYSPCYDTMAYIKDTCITDCKSIFVNRFNPYTQGLWGNWRTDKAYVFYDARKQNSTAVATNIRKDGALVNYIPYWNFGTDTLTASGHNRWVWNQEITRVNKKGMETENRDPLGRYNSGLYGYNQTLPVAVAQNARYRQVVYEGFEDYDYYNDSCGRRCPPPRHLDWSSYAAQFSTTVMHSGKYSLKVASGQNAAVNFSIIPRTTDTISPLLVRSTVTSCTRLDSIYSSNDNITTPVFSPMQSDSLVVGLWAKEAKDCQCDSFINNRAVLIFYDSSNAIIATYSLRPGGNIIDGWQRYESFVQVPVAAVSANLSLQNISSGGSATDAFFDDVRVHPFNSNIKSFVYNNINLRLMAELDENNYASFYEYDDEGTLIRVKKETQQGIKTIQETRSVLLKQ